MDGVLNKKFTYVTVICLLLLGAGGEKAVGALTQVEDSLSSYASGQMATHFIKFTNSITISRTGTIVIEFPDSLITGKPEFGFSSGSVIAAFGAVSNGGVAQPQWRGGFSQVQVFSDSIRLLRDGYGQDILANSTINLMMALIRNPRTQHLDAKVTVKIYDSQPHIPPPPPYKLMESGMSAPYHIDGPANTFDIQTIPVQTAGVSFALKITNAKDVYQHPAGGTVTINALSGGSPSPSGALPVLNSVSLFNGVGQANQILFAAETGVVLRGSSTLYSRNSNAFNVVPGGTGKLTLSGEPATTASGVPFINDITVRANDLYGNLATAYAGTVSFSSSDPFAALPAAAMLINGERIFSASSFRLSTAGLQKIWVSDGTLSNSTGNIVVTPGAISSFILSVPTSVTAGVATTVTVSGAVDAGGNSTNGTVNIAFNDGQPHAAPDGTTPVFSQVQVVNGVGTGSVTLFKTESGVRLRGSVPGFTDDTDPFSVTPGSAGGLDLTLKSPLPSWIAAGQSLSSIDSMIVDVKDLYGNRKTNYAGLLSFGSSDPAASLPKGVYSFSNGRCRVSGDSLVFKTAGVQTISVQTASFSQKTDAVRVASGMVTSFSLNVNASQVAGVSFPLQVYDARDAYGNAADGTVIIRAMTGGSTSPNGQSPVLTPIAVVGGIGQAFQTLVKVESVRLIGEVFSGPTVVCADTTAGITITAGLLGNIKMSGIPATIPLNSTFPGDITVRFYDDFGNSNTFSGTLHFRSSDASASLPGDDTFVNASQRVYAANLFKLASPGTQKIYVQALGITPQIADSSGQIDVSAALISRIRADAAKVSIGQSNIPVVMEIQNWGTLPLTDVVGQLKFSNGSYSFTGPATAITIPARTPAGPSTEQLTFYVRVLGGSTAGTNTVVDGSMSGKFSGTTLVVDSALPGGTTHSWFVQNEANLLIKSVDVLADTVQQGQQQIAIEVEVQNGTDAFFANALIQSTSFQFLLNNMTDASDSFRVTRDITNPVILTALQTAKLKYYLQSSTVAPQGYVFVHPTIQYVESNTMVTKFAQAAMPDLFYSVEAGSLQIIEIQPSQPAVTQGQTTPWQVRVVVKNTGSFPLTLDFNPAETLVQFRRAGTDYSSQFVIEAPATFSDGTTSLSSGDSKSVLYTITATTFQAGTYSIFSRIKTLEGLVASDAFGSVEVQTSEDIRIAQVRASQPTVTALDTTFDWHIDVLVSNQGGSAVEIDTLRSMLVFANSDSFILARPKLLQWGTILKGGQSDTLRFAVRRAGESLGLETIDAALYFANLNSGKPDSAKTLPSARGTVTLQNPANGYISAIAAVPDTLTQNGTTPWHITLHLNSQANAGDILLDLENTDSTYVRLFKDGIWQSDYTLQMPAALAGSGTRLLKAGTADSLIFTGVSMGAADSVLQAVVRVAGKEVNRNRPVRLSNLAPTATLTIQTPANLSVQANSMQPSYISGGAFYRFQVNVLNSGESMLLLEAGSTYLTFTDGAITFTTLLDAALSTRIPGSDSQTLYFNAQSLPVDFRTGRYTPELHLVGAQNGDPFEQIVSLTDNMVTVGDPREVMITALRSLATSVTIGQTKPWTIELDVTNNGSATMYLDSSQVIFLLGAQDVSALFQVSRPDTFINGSRYLRGSASSTVRYGVNGISPGMLPGQVTIAGHIWLTDSTQTFRKVDEQTNEGNTGYVLVQSPAELQLADLRSSQSTVSRGQNVPWTIRARVSNGGGSQVTLDLAQTQLRFSNGDTLYTVQPPLAFLGSNTLLLDAGHSDSLQWRVLSVSAGPAVLGPIQIDARIQATENNTDRVLVIDSGDFGKTVTVLAQDSAKVRIDSVRAVLPQKTFANTGQDFYLQAKVTNPGEGDWVRRVRIGWRSDGFVLFPNGQEVQIDSIRAASSKWTEPGLLVKAGNVANVFDNLTAHIISSEAHNTGQSATQLPSALAQDTTAILAIQQPGILQIVQVSTSKDTIPSGSVKPWYIYVDVANSGQGVLLLEPPAASDITLRPGFAVAAPVLSAEERRLTFGVAKRLTYEVTVSGAGSGIMPVTARIRAADGNDPLRVLNPQSGQDEVFISTSARVQIAQTNVNGKAYNVDDQGIVHVNTRQLLNVQVRVENNGGQVLDSVYVRLRGTRSKIITTNPQVINDLGVNDADYFRLLTFQIQADSLENLMGEALIADIPRAVGEDGSIAKASLSPDSTVTLKIYRPAELRLINTHANTPSADRSVSYKQTFPVDVYVKNLGTEAIDSVQVHLVSEPANRIKLLENDLVIPARIASGDTGLVTFTATADTISGLVNIRSEIRSSKGVNAGTPAPVNRVGQDSSTTVTVEAAAKLRIVSVAAPQNVTAGDNQNDWRIYVKVINDGAADLKFENISPANITFSVQGNVDTYYQVNAPAKLVSAEGLILAGGRQDSLLFIVTQVGKIAGDAEVRVNLQASDQNKAPGAGNLMTATGKTTMTVNSYSWVRISLTSVVAKNYDNLGRALVNRGRLAEIKVEAETSEITGVDSVRIELSSAGASSIIQPVLVIGHIGKGSKDSVKFQVVTDDSWDALLRERSETWTARILSAKAEGSQLPAEVREPARPTDAVALMRIQNPAKVDVQLMRTAGQDSILTAGQFFTVYVKLLNLGTAAMSSGKFTLQLPAGKNYALADGEMEREFSIPIGQISVMDTLHLLAPNNDSFNDAIGVRITQIPQDENEKQAASAEKMQTSLVFTTLRSGLTLDFIIDAPKGARDGEVSTGQQFELRAIVHATSNILNKSVRIIVPTDPSFSLLSSETQSIITNPDTVYWRIQVPQTETDVARTFIAEARGLSADGWQTIQKNVTINKIVERASLYLDFLVVSDPVDGVMENGQANFSTDQVATLKTLVTNQGSAKVNGRGKVTLHLQRSGLRLNAGDSVQTFTIGSDISWVVKASNTTILDSRAIYAEITEAPQDTNTNIPANIGKGASYLNVRTEPRGVVQLKNFYISSPTGATDRTVSAGQSFDITATITSTNVKEMMAEIGYTGGFQTNNPAVSVPAGPNQVVKWNMIAPAEPAANNAISLTVSAKDYRSGTSIVPNSSSTITVTTQPRTKFNFSARITAPAGLTNMISSKSDFQLTLYINHQSDTALPNPADVPRVQLFVPSSFITEGETLVKSGLDSLVWNLRAPAASQDTLFDIWFSVLDLPKDANSGLSAVTDFSRISYPIYVVQRARVEMRAQINEQPPEAVVPIRIGNEFDLSSTLQNLGTADYYGTYQMQLQLPSGYTTRDDKSVTTDTKRWTWRIKAPEKVSPDPDTLVVRLTRPPKDVLSRTDADVVVDSAMVLVQPQSGFMVIKSFAVKPASVTLRGGKAIPLLGLSLQNKDESVGTKSLLDTVKVAIKNRSGAPVAARSVISRIAAVVHDQPTKVIAENTSPGNSPELVLNFTSATPDTISAANEYKFDLIVDIAAAAQISDFAVSIDSSSAVIARDAIYHSRLGIMDSTLAPVQYLGYNSGTMVIVEDALEESFCNYPNPFGTSGRPITKFVYYLQEAGDFQLKIFTLTGDLVYAWEFTKAAHPKQTSAGVHQDDITWDGRNGRGDKVMNGVYLAYLKTEDGKVAVTKIAVIK